MNIFSTFVYEPLYNGLIVLYHFLGNDLGIAIIVLTILIKTALLHMSRKQIASQKEMQEIQPLIKKLQVTYKDDREKLAKKTMALYKEHKINPAAGCLPLIVQMIVFITLYRVIINLLQREETIVNQNLLYSFVPHVESVNEFSMGILHLGNPSYVLAVVTAAAQYYQIKMMQAKNAADTEEREKKTNTKEKDVAATPPDFATVMSKQMLIIIPVMTLVVGFTFPAGLTLYWLISTAFMIVQQWFIMNKKAV